MAAGDDEEEIELVEVEETTERGVPIVGSVPPPLPSSAPALPDGASGREVIKSLERQIAALRRDLAMRSEAIAKAVDRRKALEDEANELRKRLVAVEQQLADRSGALTEARTLVGEMRARLDESKGKLDEALAAHDKRCEELASARAELDTRSSEASRLMNEMIEVETARLTDAKERDAANKAKGGAEARIRALEDELADAKSALFEAERKVETVEADAARDQLARDAALADALGQARREREDLERAHAAAISSVRDAAVAEALRVLKREKPALKEPKEPRERKKK
ncbi:MAG TPA: hypothetical protein VIF62_01995 [Labilithrix sp.]|jgi:chromosome segregation ATPase